MAIEYIEEVTINGLNRAFNGYIYSVDYEPSLADSPSRLTIRFVSEDGTYIEPSLSTKIPYVIKLGSKISLNMYAVSWQVDRSTDQKVLNVIFYDGSIALDKFYVGLYNRHGTVTTNCLIIVGREMSVCDTNQDGRVDVDDTPMADSCDPCPLCHDGQTNSCEDLACTTNFDIMYTFNDLVTEMKKVGLKLYNVPTTNDYYYCEYTGTLREVLREWGADYGFNFFWEDGMVKFMDVKQEIDISSVEPAGKVTEDSYGKSIEYTEGRMAISLYKRDGGRNRYDCNRDQLMTLRCLTLRDLYGSTVQFNGFTQTLSIDQFQNLVAFSAYSRQLRDAYMWVSGYGIKTAANATSLIGTELDYMGGMKIRKVIAQGTADFTKLYGALGSTSLGTLNTISQDEKVNIERIRLSSGNLLYFIIYEERVGKADQLYALEQNLAGNFLGKHWVGQSTPQFCGGFDKDTSISINAPDGQAKMFSADQPGIGQEFREFGPSSGSVISDLFSINSSQSVSQRDYYCLLNRDASWYPTENDKGYYQGTFDYMFIRSPADIGQGKPDKAISEIDSSLTPTYSDGSGLKMALCIETPSGFVLTYDTINNTVDNGKLKLLDYETYNGQCINNGNLKIQTYGLINTKTTQITLKEGGRSLIDITLPSQSSTLLPQINSLLSSRFPTGWGYRVSIKQSYSQYVFVPKILTVKQDGIETACSANTIATSVNFKEINDSDLNIMDINECSPSDANLQTAHDRLNKNLTFYVDKPRQEKSFTIAGIDLPSDKKASIENGLIGLNISVDSGGVSTRYDFSSRPAQIPRIDRLTRFVQMKLSKKTQVSNANH